ncbi:uncharacterized protein [Coffea arabica]|uniref:Uncharacterized protein n=1 Tax=Coffea arabica TaxID=13443 RepID=A0A6P6WUM3_COFAR|nr:CYC02 protein-like [Coffea arabica]XP_027119177.1 CYC02 protein-like [Coffea arabica]
MAPSKNLLFVFGVLFALVLLISSDATAADQKSVKTTGVHDASSGQVHQDSISEDRCKYRCCRWYHGQCQKCCRTAEETPEATSGDEDTVTADRCRHGCCRWYHGNCQRCCPPAEETTEATSENEDTVTADGCRHGCCRWYHGRCQRCCPTAEETPEATSGDEVKN